MLGLAGIPSLVQFFGMLCMPESPRWLGKTGQSEAQRKVMHLIYKTEHIERANAQLTKEIDALKEETKLSEMERLKSLCTTYSRCLVIGCGIQAFQQLIGINTAMYYGPDIMQQAGIKIPSLSEKESSLVLNIPLSFFNAIGTILSIFFIDRLGRRYLILRTTPLIALTWFITATGMAFTGENMSESE